MIKILSVIVLLASWLPASSYAQAVPAASSFDRFMWSVTGGSSQTVGFGSSGQPIVVSAPPMIDTDGGLPRVSTSGTLTNPAGKPVLISATARISALQTAKAVGHVLSAISLPVVAGVAVYDLMKELGFLPNRAPDGSLVVTKPNPIACLPDCYVWVFKGNKYATIADASAAAQSYYSLYGAFVSVKASSFDVYEYLNASHSSSTVHRDDGTYQLLSAANFPPLPSSSNEFLDAVATKSGWPATSNISKVLAEPSAGAIEKIQPEPLTVTGPATSSGAVKTSVRTLPDGSTETTTETTEYKHSYAGPNVSTTTSTTTNVQTCTGAGSCSQSSSTTTTQPVDPAPDGVATDTAFSDLPQLYKPKYADGLEGVWAAKSAALKASPLLSLVNQLMPNIGVGGACPSWMLNLDIGPWAYGSYDVAPPCYIWDFAKVFVIIGALLLARVLVFGG